MSDSDEKNLREQMREIRVAILGDGMGNEGIIGRDKAWRKEVQERFDSQDKELHSIKRFIYKYYWMGVGIAALLSVALTLFGVYVEWMKHTP